MHSKLVGTHEVNFFSVDDHVDPFAVEDVAVFVVSIPEVDSNLSKLDVGRPNAIDDSMI